MPKHNPLRRVFLCLLPENNSHSHLGVPRGTFPVFCFFPENAKKYQKFRLTKNFWRGGASSSTTTIFNSVARAIISAKAKFVKSFLRVWTKFFRIAMVILARRRRLYSSRPTMSSTFFTIAQNFLKRESSRRANYTVVARRCQVLFAQFVKINRLTSLCGDGIICANLGRPRNGCANFR